jgi:phage terminase large subunit
MNVDLKLSKVQHDFVSCEKKHALFAGGLGSGKSYALAVWVIIMATKHPDARGLIVANDYKQLHRATLTALFNLLAILQIPFSYVGNKGVLRIGKAEIHCVSMTNYDSLRGAEYGWAACDEAAFYKKEAFEVLLGRIRDNKGPRFVRLVSTPSGFNWLYDLFVTNADEDSKIFYAKTADNRHLPEDYLKALEKQYDSKLLAQETEGAFINVNSGSVYYGFNRAKNVQEFDPMRLPQKLGMDFNVHPMTAVYGYVSGDKIYIEDELFLENSNTPALCAEAERRWGKLLTVYPDSTGKNRSTQSNKTNHLIIKEHFNLVYTENPHRIDRFACVNNLLEKNRIIIHPRCKYLIKDLERFTHENKDEMLSHISDALGYLAWAHFPLRAPAKPSTTIQL